MTTSPHETTPLLEGQNESQNEHSPQPSPKYGLWHVVAVTCSAALLFDVAGYLGVTAQTAIFEEIVCQEYHATHVLDQEGCKIEPIQTEIALLNALIDTFQTIPGKLCSFCWVSLRLTGIHTRDTAGSSLWHTGGQNRV